MEWIGRWKNEETFNRGIAHIDGVKDTVEFTAEQVRDRAERALLRIRQDPNYTGADRARILLRPGKETDQFVILDDPDGAAMSIEYGRAGYFDDDGELWGYMPPSFILTDAARLPRKRQVTPKKRSRKRAKKEE